MLPPREASKGEKKEHNLYFAFAVLREPNYVIFVKASLLFSYCQPLSHRVSDGAVTQLEGCLSWWGSGGGLLKLL